MTEPEAGVHAWRGNVVYNDNHTNMEKTHELNTRYGAGPHITDDHIFAEVGGTIEAGRPIRAPTLAEHNAIMIFQGAIDTYGNVYRGDD